MMEGLHPCEPIQWTRAIMKPDAVHQALTIPTRFQIKHYDGYEDTHAHDYHQIVIPLRGVMEMDVEGRAERVVENSAAIIHHGAKHRFAAPKDDAFLIVDINSYASDNTKTENRTLWNDRHDNPFLQIDPAINQICEFFTAEIRNNRLQGVHAMTAGEMLVVALEQRLGIDHGPVAKGMTAALGFMETHCHLPITIDQVASVAGMSVSHFHDHFRTQFDQSLKRYILARRLKKAASMLEQTRHSLAQIAFDSGYGDQASFSRAFRRMFGLTPAQWRKNLCDSEK